MKRNIIVCSWLFGSFILSQATSSTNTGMSYDPNARINLNPRTEQVHTEDGRELGDILMTIDLAAIGMPGDGYDNAGLTWDGQYLYLLNQFDNSVYMIDPTGPMITMSWPLAPLFWGLGREQNLWGINIADGFCYELEPPHRSFYALVQGTFGMADISEWWQDGELWILAVGGSNKAYKFDINTGTCIDSIGHPSWTVTSQRGLTYDPWNDKFWIGGWNSGMVWELNTDGTPTGRQFSFNNVASLAYDWQSSIHPEPVLWIATNDAANQIFMVDPDNVQPYVAEQPKPAIQETFGFTTNTPNPSRGGCQVSYSTITPGSVKIKIYDITGRLVRTLVDRYESAGERSVHWNCRDNNDSRGPNGVYLATLETVEGQDIQKLIVYK
ncbi:hypothetical protein AMJ83_00875 [candidate division WOR_3 bacterium SM23_42]|uniref:FlgD/Vpr Ig-like domain-containing protein n=1 Tax=candidate division WOR_3 bacterium SM23_42 TaxID=1703779 RepID=A0A0S8FXT3_UNCW3|nr:MAG: hypothetical protein AMJ83_00875 [candidate division WOR_3 bacterium SM23_42]